MSLVAASLANAAEDRIGVTRFQSGYMLAGEEGSCGGEREAEGKCGGAR
jgi:hypothetical protein